jgi:hypothetical protein
VLASHVNERSVFGLIGIKSIDIPLDLCPEVFCITSIDLVFQTVLHNLRCVYSERFCLGVQIPN